MFLTFKCYIPLGLLKNGANIVKSTKIDTQWPLKYYSWSQGLREKFFQGVRRSIPGPQNSLPQTCAKFFILIFCPKLGEEQKKRSLLICPKLGEEQNEKKRSSLNFSPIFCPKLGEEQKKRSSLKFSPINTPLGATPKLNAET